ncbi:MAG TPA: DUF1820 family protein [Verrucomicrobiae bacterium]|nr:DUF1820 family protein [Verrucomicrobiae bacterium]
MAPRRRIYRVSFLNQGRVYEIYARKVDSSPVYGFVQIEELIFGERSSIVLDPGEEQLKHEFAGVKKTMVPYHNVIRIDEVEKEGAGKILQLAPVESPAASVPQLPRKQ